MPSKKPPLVRREEKLEFSLQGWEKIQSLMKKAEVKTFPALVRTAIALLDWYLEKKSQGCTFLIEQDGKQKNVVFQQQKPYLPN